jgi:hypothetical protein
MKRFFLGLPIFETVIVILFASGIVGALLVGAIAWIRS